MEEKPHLKNNRTGTTMLNSDPTDCLKNIPGQLFFFCNYFYPEIKLAHLFPES